MNGITGWLVSLPTWAVAAIVALLLLATVAAWYLVAANLIDRGEPGPQRGLVKPPPRWTAPLPADTLFTPFDSTDEFRAVPVNGRRPVSGTRHSVREAHRQRPGVPPWVPAPRPRDGEAAGG